MLHWDRDSLKIASKIACSNSTIKAIVKTRDEIDLIKGWIDHHAEIFGLNSLIVADNMSSSPAIHEIYKSYGNELNIFQFEGNHNDIHGNGRFSVLYDALKNSSQYAIFLDADERLIWIEGNRWTADRSIVDSIVTQASGRGVNGTWLVNAPNSFDCFSIVGGRPTLDEGKKWGKPVIRSEFLGRFPVIHNSQYPDWMTNKTQANNLFILHMMQFPQRRIIANRYKLINRGIFPQDATIDDILKADMSSSKYEPFMRFIDEIRGMQELERNTSVSDYRLLREYIAIESDGRISSIDPDTLQTLNNFIAQEEL